MTVDVLVTGANGQLGFEVANLLKNRGLQIAALGRGELDVSDQATVNEVIERLAPKVIINAAAYTAVDKAESDCERAFAVNRDGPAFLAQVAERSAAAIIHFSTDYVFDGTKTGAYTENDRVAPLGVYGQSKEAGEQAVRAATARHLILRTAWVYGGHGANFVKTMLRLGAERSELRIVDDQRGCPTFAVDLAETVVELCSRIVDGRFAQNGYGTFHCAGGSETSWYGFARKIFELSPERVKKDLKVVPILTSEFPTLAQRPANSVLDCHLLEQIHGLKLRSWSDALADLLGRLETVIRNTASARA